MRSLLVLVVLAILIFAYSDKAVAKDLGKYGSTTGIKEEGFLAMIARKLKTVDIEKEQENMKAQAQKRIDEPVPVKGIIRTKEARSFTFDPTYILLEDIYLPSGTLMHPAGTKVNPLDHMDLDRKMIFIDAKDQEQITWLETQVKKHNGAPNSREETLIVILVSGRPLELQEKLQKVVYFDQNGELTSKFGIRQVPAIIMQEDKLLHIDEINIDIDKSSGASKSMSRDTRKSGSGGNHE